MRTQVRKIGNSLGNIIPAAFIKQLGLVEGADIEVKVDGQKITIEPIKRPKKRFPCSEKELLNGLDAHTAHADELAVVSTKELAD
ncbi:AbrB/MazE/SpoVT family DNA-binding domain-containing protein (plasmid) [Vibrio coralliilyticus]|uniref:AbrB/MazE/SpoVT family DNA-binding domain-containing protein n=1 Tax=Vibrio coralliilyticus TaxID=190893 RepID=UPI00051283ED|nr:AbrB/MazE/SpoVT family DNA-binding domain-containing protein [Vibrio coralliilyticus]AIS58273.1 cell division protein [Vibrio coralliilyticus]